MNPSRVAKQLKKKFGQNVDIHQLIDYFGFILLQVDSKDFIGGYRYIARRRVIQIKTSLDDNMKRCILWHELGHALCHRTVNCYYMANKTRLRTNMYEVEAEQFAAEMLLPDQLDEELYGRSVEEIARFYGVTENLVEMKWGK